VTHDRKQHSSDNGDNPQVLRIIQQVEGILWACDLNLKFTYLNPVIEKNSDNSAEKRKQLSLKKT